MKSIKYILLSLLVLFLFNSCEYEIDYKGDLPKNKLVIGAFIQADSIISISLFKSAKPGTYYNESMFMEDQITDNEIDTSSYVSDARAELYINGTLRETLTSGINQNKYNFSIIPRTNDNVDIKMSYKDYDQAIGSAKLNLIKPSIDSANILVQESIDTIYEKTYRIVLYLEISDNGNENYYQIDPELYYSYSQSEYKLSLNNAELLWESIPGVYQENSTSFQSSANRFGVISNKKFKGGTYKIKLGIKLEPRFITYPSKAIRKVYGSLNISSIDKKSYDYLFTLNRYYNSSFMNEPVIILDGVENAYGFIGAKNSIKARSINFSFETND